MVTRQTDEVLNRFCATISERLRSRLKKVILFGSKARGDDTHDSDYDCLIVVDEVTPDVIDGIDEIAGEFLYRHNAVFSVFPISERVDLTNTYDPFLRNIHKEGIVL